MRIASLAENATLVKRSTLGRGVFDGREGTDVELFAWWLQFQKDAAGYGIPLRVVWGVRTFQQQADLLKQGHTKAGPGKSPHNFGMALDVIHMRRAWQDMPREGWALLGQIGKETARKRNIALTWGGDWRFYDPVHWERTDWRDRAAADILAHTSP